MNLTLGKRMVVLGLIVTAGLLTLAALGAFTNYVNQKSAAEVTSRVEEIRIIDRVITSQLILRGVAKDVLVSRDNGYVPDELLATINRSNQTISENLQKLKLLLVSDVIQDQL